MAARQRLRTILDARRASRPCWRCALNLPRHNSTSPAGIPGSSNRSDEVPYSQILQQGLEETLKSHFPNPPVKPAAKILDESESESSQRVQEPRVRLMSDGQRVPLRTRSDSISSAPREPRIRRIKIQIHDQQVPSGTEPQSKSTETTQRPRIIRIPSEGQSVPLRTWSEFISSAPREPRIRRIKLPIHDQQVASGMEPRSKSMATTQKPRIRVMQDGQTITLRSLPEFMFLATPIRRIGVDRQQEASGTEPQSKSTENIQKPRIRSIQEKSNNQPVTLSTRSRSRRKKAAKKPRIRVMQNGQTIPLRSLPEFMSLAHRARIRRIGVMTDRQQEASGTEPQSKPTENIQKPRIQSIQVKSDNLPVTSSTRSESRRKRAAKKPRIQRSDSQPLALGTQDILHSQKNEQSLQPNEPQAPRIIPKRVLSKSKRELEPFIRPISTMTPPGSEAPDALLEKLSKTELRKWKIVSKRGLDPVIRTKHTASVEHEDEACYEELRSALDVYMDLHTSNLSNSIGGTRHLFSSTRFSPQNSVNRRIALSENSTLNRPSLAVPNRPFSSRTRRAPDRRFATATVSKGRLPLIFDPLKPSTESDYAGGCPNQPGHHWIKSRWAGQRKIWRHTRGA